MSRRVIDERDALRRTVARQDEQIRELERTCDRLHRGNQAECLGRLAGQASTWTSHELMSLAHKIRAGEADPI